MYLWFGCLLRVELCVPCVARCMYFFGCALACGCACGCCDRGCVCGLIACMCLWLGCVFCLDVFVTCLYL